jgi:threonine/homoserine/homoserine lactone efflux protein
MPDLTTFSIFLTAAFILSITPGPGMLYVLARSLNGGRTEGLLSSFGTFIGGQFHVIAAAVGLSAVLMASALAFSIVKYVGAAYLIYLGVKLLLRRDAAIGQERSSGDRNAFVQGILTEILNPKTALFFLAFIPQFVHPENGNTLMQFAVLGLITTSFNLAVDVCVSLFAGPLGRQLQVNRKFRQRQRVFSGCTMIGLGTYVALADQK